jgi:hypothetical protein
MFNFLCLIKEGETVALLCGDGAPGSGYTTTFLASERRTAVVCHTSVGDEHKRLSVCRHIHKDEHIGALSRDLVCYND